jgi:hypothetical protein
MSDKENEKKSSFKKFSDLNKSAKIDQKETDQTENVLPDEPRTRPNLPKNTTKREVPADTKYLKPKKEEEKPIDESKVQFYGKLAKFPKGTKASKSYNFLENVKIAKSSIWYIMVEKCENELQMVKYNYKKGVDLSKFLNDLKGYYTKQFAENANVMRMIEAIEIDGNDKYSWIKNIPLIEVNGKKMISKITEDLIKLLSK